MAKKRENKTKKSVQEIKEQMRSGDQLLIADIIGCTSDYVNMVLRETRKSDKILNLFSELIENRNAFIAKYKKI